MGILKRTFRSVTFRMTATRVSAPGRALTVLFAGFPLWWVLGISNFVALGAATVMLGELLRRRNIAVPKGFGWWLAYLAVYVAGGALLAVDAPWALPEAGAGGIVTWVYRLAWYAAATVTMLYVGNLEQLTRAWFCRVLGWMFVVLVGGGLFAVAFPTFTFTSLIELVLPRSLANVEFVKFLVHPTLVQLYEGAATDTPRPSAPFAYANTWGVAYACFLPFFLVGWWREGSRARRVVAAAVLLLSLIPVVSSLNRGLWASLLVALVFVVLRAALAGRVQAAAALAGASALAGAVLLTGPAQEMIQTRLDNPTSNASRIQLAELTVQSMWQGSPLVGFGNTRDVASSFYSIAGGDTPGCPRCSPPALGTQGHLWLVSYTQGLLGLVLYAGFFVTIVVAGLRTRDPYVTAGLTVLLMHLVTSPVYDTVGMPLLAILGAVGLIWRSVPSPAATTRSYALLLRRHTALIAVLCVAGAGAGVLWQVHRGVPAVASVSMELPIEPIFVTDDQGPGTMDNEAQFARSSTVLAAIGEAVGRPVAPRDLGITATANSRLLNLRFSGRTAQEAESGVSAAAETILAQRSGVLHERLAATSTSLVRQSAGLQAAVKTLDETEKVLGEGSPQFEERRQELLARSGVVVSRQARAEVAPLQAGDLVHPARTHIAYGSLRIAFVSGAVAGFLLGALLARRLDLTGPRLRHRRASARSGVPVLAVVNERDLAAPNWTASLGPVLLRRPAVCLAVPGSVPAALVAGELDRWGPKAPDPGVLLVAQTSTRLPELVRLRTVLERSGHTVHGLVLVRTAVPWRRRPILSNQRMAVS